MGFLDVYKSLSIIDVVYAALVALVLTNLILSFKKLKSVDLGKQDNATIKAIQLNEMQKRCEELFPITTINFNGDAFKKGMNVKITTLQNKIVEGVLIGKNSSDVLCIITPKRIIAQDIDKIKSLINLDK